MHSPTLYESQENCAGSATSRPIFRPPEESREVPVRKAHLSKTSGIGAVSSADVPAAAQPPHQLRILRRFLPGGGALAAQKELITGTEEAAVAVEGASRVYIPAAHPDQEITVLPPKSQKEGQHQGRRAAARIPRANHGQASGSTQVIVYSAFFYSMMSESIVIEGARHPINDYRAAIKKRHFA